MNLDLAFHNLRESCIRCFLEEMLTWPAHKEHAKQEIAARNYPPCFCRGEARLRFKEATSQKGVKG